MKQTLFDKIKSSIRNFICKIFHHEYSCCNSIFDSCKKCIFCNDEEFHKPAETKK